MSIDKSLNRFLFDIFVARNDEHWTAMIEPIKRRGGGFSGMSTAPKRRLKGKGHFRMLARHDIHHLFGPGIDDDQEFPETNFLKGGNDSVDRGNSVDLVIDFRKIDPAHSRASTSGENHDRSEERRVGEE